MHWERITSKKYQEGSWRYENVQEKNVKSQKVLHRVTNTEPDVVRVGPVS